ncbi:ABC transporter ATP-binding protein/permease [Treponema sp.]|uniref:ABC transporter ATP-binding protein/permease n=1 Tax=Treponema sp. TaxID=166 RepID=UPI00257AA8B0|nr:ABC transporter ATP-binding protein/permease [Treponema sp.]MBE6354226.1 ABC transporter ATP-binding protein/permease [Treponema sp.]
MMINPRLIKAVPESKKYVFLTVLLKLISLASNILIIFSTAQIIRTQGKSIKFPVLFIAAGIILNCMCAFLISIAGWKASSKVKITLRSMIYRKLLQLGTDYAETSSTAKTIQLAAEGVEQIEVWFGQYLPQFFYSMLASVTVFTVLCFLNVKMAVILFLCVPLIPVSIICVQKIAKRLLSRYWDQYASLADNFLENLQGLTTLEIYQADEFKQEQMKKEAEHFRKITMKVLSMQLNSIIIMDIVAYAGAGLGIMAAVSAFSSGNLSLADCFICILLSADFFIPLRRLGSFFHTAMNGTTAAKKIFALLDTECPDTKKRVITEIPACRTKNILELKNVSCTYGERTVLKNACIEIPEHSYTAFVGKSGSGKSTAAKILCGINSRYEGKALICGTEISSINTDTLYKKISYLSHRDWIFKGTVRETLLEGKAGADEEQMRNVLAKVNLLAFIDDNGGLDAEILENASNLSGGQKQRLSIARALLHDGDIFIFDESTSNIDVESEKIILNLLHELKKSKTIIMISHRKENCSGADNIYFFDNGICKKTGGTL